MPIVIGGVILIIVGLAGHIKPDWFWAYAKWSNEAKGIASERTQAYDDGLAISATISIMLGVGLICLGSSLP